MQRWVSTGMSLTPQVKWTKHLYSRRWDKSVISIATIWCLVFIRLALNLQPEWCNSHLWSSKRLIPHSIWYSDKTMVWCHVFSSLGLMIHLSLRMIPSPRKLSLISLKKVAAGWITESQWLLKELRWRWYQKTTPMRKRNSSLKMRKMRRMPHRAMKRVRNMVKMRWKMGSHPRYLRSTATTMQEMSPARVKIEERWFHRYLWHHHREMLACKSVSLIR